MTQNLTRERATRIDPADDPVRPSSWRNLYFAKDGKWLTGWEVHADEELARTAADESVREWRANEPCIGLEGTDPSHMFMPREFSHHTQIPVNP
ncbi:MAG: hypothetical protein WAL34_04210 [Acidobacteriaceae bacterium]